MAGRIIITHVAGWLLTICACAAAPQHATAQVDKSADACYAEAGRRAVPAGLKQFADSLDTLRDNSRKLDPSHQFTLTDIIARQMRAAYPGYGAYINCVLATQRPKVQPIPPPTSNTEAVQESSPWLRENWTDETCPSTMGFSARELCRALARDKLRKDLDSITDEGQDWIRQACPGVSAYNLDGCAYREVSSMLRPGWPSIEGQSSADQNDVWLSCPKRMAPSKWRDCAQAKLAQIAPGRVQPKLDLPIERQFPDPPSRNTVHVPTGSLKALPPWKVPNTAKPARALHAPIAARDLFKTAGRSVYIVVADKGDPSSLSQGSAIAVSTNEAITNCHVVEHSSVIVVSDGVSHLQALVSSADQKTDRCYLLVFGGNLNPIAGFRDHSDLVVGEQVYTIGAPRGLDKTLGQGLISGLREHKGVRYVQMTAPISPGSSGGGLFDDRGNLIGVTTFAVRESQSINFAIAASEYWK